MFTLNGTLRNALLSKPVPTEASFRTRLNAEAEVLILLIDRINTDLIINREAPITPLHSGHAALDIDVRPKDNSRSIKEGIYRAYKEASRLAVKLRIQAEF